MSDVSTTVTLELLRHGPAHNQLLSPLTQYLGLCGNFGAATVRVPYEQQEFISRLKALRYEGDGSGDTDQRRLGLSKSGEEMAQILGSVPGLISALGADTNTEGLVHLNVVLSAAELAMLPFELAKVPPGCTGGEGNWLLLQTRLPITLTRQVRSVANRDTKWPRAPRILFIVAAPGLLQVPAKHHMQALVQCIEPWIGEDRDDREKYREKIQETLTVVENATTEKIQAACAEHVFTHVHILAHGMENPILPGKPYGLALHDPKDERKVEVVDGDRLASLLCSLGSGDGVARDARGASRPSVVTVASCDSGNVSSVVYSSGASLAHDLHRAGIPLVVASQFPLSQAGSVHIPRTLYPALLWGDDPRCALARLRGILYSLSGVTHDWASLVAYAALPDDFERQLKDVRYTQSKRAINAALAPTDELLDDLATEVSEGAQPTMNEALAAKLDARIGRVNAAVARMPDTGAYETEGTGMKASTEKRTAQLHFSIALMEAKEQRAQRLQQSLASLDKSLELYRRAYRSNMRESEEPVPRRSVHWVLGQYLSLRAVLGEPFEREHWSAAKLSARIDLEESRGDAVVWPFGTLAELHFILLAYPAEQMPMSHDEAADQVRKQIKGLIAGVSPDSFAIESTRRQFLRYSSWWGHPELEAALKDQGRKRPRPWREPGGVVELAGEVVGMLTPPGKRKPLG
jgi:hypothetical protein